MPLKALPGTHADPLVIGLVPNRILPLREARVEIVDDEATYVPGELLAPCGANGLQMPESLDELLDDRIELLW